MFTPMWGKDPIWRAYSDGLKPSTRESVVVPVFSGFLWQVGLFFVRPPTSIHMSRTANLHPECRPETWKEEKHPILEFHGNFPRRSLQKHILQIDWIRECMRIHWSNMIQRHLFSSRPAAYPHFNSYRLDSYARNPTTICYSNGATFYSWM